MYKWLSALAISTCKYMHYMWKDQHTNNFFDNTSDNDLQPKCVWHVHIHCVQLQHSHNIQKCTYHTKTEVFLLLFYSKAVHKIQKKVNLRHANYLNYSHIDRRNITKWKSWIRFQPDAHNTVTYRTLVLISLLFANSPPLTYIILT